MYYTFFNLDLLKICMVKHVYYITEKHEYVSDFSTNLREIVAIPPIPFELIMVSPAYIVYQI